MVAFEIVSTQDVQVDGIGTLYAGQARTLTEEELRMFEVRNGYSITQANFPPHVEVVAVVESTKKSAEEPSEEEEKPRKATKSTKKEEV